jgi:hypothetical protein
MNQEEDRRLADLAWRVLYVRQAVMEFCPLKREEEEAAEVYQLRPHVNAP